MLSPGAHNGFSSNPEMITAIIVDLGARSRVSLKSRIAHDRHKGSVSLVLRVPGGTLCAD